MGRLWVAVYYIHSSGATSKTDILAITKFTTIGYDLYNLVDTTLDVQLDFFIFQPCLLWYISPTYLNLAISSRLYLTLSCVSNTPHHLAKSSPLR